MQTQDSIQQSGGLAGILEGGSIGGNVAPVAETPIVEPPARWEGPADAVSALIAAWAKASGSFAEIERDAKGQIGNRYFKYAPLVNLTKATRKQLAVEGILTIQAISSHPTNPELHVLTTTVAGLGAKYVTEIHFTPARLVKVDAVSDRDSAQVTNLKEYGKQTTYLRRYAYQCVHVLDATDDADEAPAERPEPAQRPQESRQQRREPSAPPARERAPQQTRATEKPAEQASAPAAAPAPVPVPGDSRVVPEDDGISSMADADIIAGIKQAGEDLGIGDNKVAATKLSIEIAGHVLRDLDRAGRETLLRGLRLRVAAAESAASS